jgi:hypothetical protein
MFVFKKDKGKIAHKQLRWTTLIIGCFLACTLSTVFSWFAITGELERYPNSESVTLNCGGILFDVSRPKTIWFVSCYATTDERSIIESWYRQRGWFSFGEREIYPSFIIGKIPFERGKVFTIDLEDNGKILIVQQIIYRVGNGLITP